MNENVAEPANRASTIGAVRDMEKLLSDGSCSLYAPGRSAVTLAKGFLSRLDL
jgi:hypothetical protein